MTMNFTNKLIVVILRVATLLLLLLLILLLLLSSLLVSRSTSSFIVEQAPMLAVQSFAQEGKVFGADEANKDGF